MTVDPKDHFATKAPDSYMGKFLVADPYTPDTQQYQVENGAVVGHFFARQVILVIEEFNHNGEDLVRGIVINLNNNAVPDLSSMVQSLSSSPDQDAQKTAAGIETYVKDQGNAKCRFGGPLSNEQAFVVTPSTWDNSSPDAFKSETANVFYTLTSLKDIVGQEGPDKFYVNFGYAYWSKAELDELCKNGAWHVCDADPDILFDTNPENQWKEAFKRAFPNKHASERILASLDTAPAQAFAPPKYEH